MEEEAGGIGLTPRRPVTGEPFLVPGTPVGGMGAGPGGGRMDTGVVGRDLDGGVLER